MSEPTTPHIIRPQVANAAGIELGLLKQWRARYVTLGAEGEELRPPNQPGWPRPLLQTLVYRAAKILADGGIPPGEGVAWCSRELPERFTAILSGKRQRATAQAGPFDGGPVVTLDLVAIVDDVLARLKAMPPSDRGSRAKSRAQATRRLEITCTKCCAQLAKLKSDAAKRGTPLTPSEIRRALDAVPRPVAKLAAQLAGLVGAAKPRAKRAASKELERMKDQRR